MNPARQPILCYVTDRWSLPGRSAAGAPLSREAALLERMREAAVAGVGWIELREKDLEGGPLCDLARGSATALEAVAHAHEGRTQLLVNGRLDVALAAGACGVHLPENSLPVGAVTEWRRQAGRADFRVGVSCHSLSGAESAARDGADYIFFGPVFETASKAAFGAPQGLARLGEVCRAVPIPVIAVGGIGTGNARACVEAGAAGIAAIGLFQQAADVSEVVAELRRRLG